MKCRVFNQQDALSKLSTLTEIVRHFPHLVLLSLIQLLCQLKPISCIMALLRSRRMMSLTSTCVGPETSSESSGLSVQLEPSWQPASISDANSQLPAQLKRRMIPQVSFPFTQHLLSSPRAVQVKSARITSSGQPESPSNTAIACTSTLRRMALILGLLTVSCTLTNETRTISEVSSGVKTEIQTRRVQIQVPLTENFQVRTPEASEKLSK